jgi:hypothetical protein
MWEKFLPVFNSQKTDGVDTEACVVFAVTNTVDTLKYATTIIPSSLDESFFIQKLGSSKDGYTPRNVLQCFKENKIISDYSTILCPLFFWRGKNDLKQALLKSPLAISVFAWSKGENGLYTRPSVFPNDDHFVMLYGYIEGVKWLVYDSYDPYLKELDWNYPFQFAYSVKL